MISSTTSVYSSNIRSLEEWLHHPPENSEWINGELVAKNGMTLKHGKIQAKIATYWRNYLNSSQQGGEVYTEVPCRTEKQGRRPDVAYLTPELVAQYGNLEVLPQSFPLSAEIISPTDIAEEAIAKALEYLSSGGEEVWLVFPENRWIIVATSEVRKIFVSGEVASTQKILLGFTVSVDELVG